jgi:CheY-like chemotaxis protein
MGGRMWAESTVGTGSTFHFTLRFGLAAEALTHPASVSQEALCGVPVLVVDDNATNRRILVETLTLWGMKPTSAESGVSALRLVDEMAKRQESFPLIVLDGHMPGMDGFTLAEKMRRDHNIAGATIMMLSSTGHLDDAHRCEQLGLSAYLVKPVRPHDLLQTIKRVLGAALPESRSRPTIQLSGQGRSLHVLLAEDNEVNRRLTVRLLETRGHAAMSVSSGKEALDALDAARFDLVLMDVQMPEMSGLDATAAIRGAEATGRCFTRDDTPRIPIVALTAHAMAGDRENCLAGGMDGYVTKPIHANELFDEIDRAIRATGSSALAHMEKSKPQPYHGDTVLQNVEGDEALLADLIQVFLESSTVEMRSIQTALESRNADQVARAAHALKGSIGVFGPSAALDAITEFENLARAGNIEAAVQRHESVIATIERLRSSLSERLPQPSPP